MKKELLIFLICLLAAFGLVLYTVLKYEHSSLFGMLHIVLFGGIVIYGLILVFRLIFGLIYKIGGFK